MGYLADDLVPESGGVPRPIVAAVRARWTEAGGASRRLTVEPSTWWPTSVEFLPFQCPTIGVGMTIQLPNWPYVAA